MADVVEGSGDLKKVVLHSPKGSTAEVYLYGAHVTSWTVDGKELLFLSREAVFKPPKAIRGGIPVCWPQFSDFGALASHGFARNSIFELRDSSRDSATLALTPGGTAPDSFPRAFELLITVTVRDAELEQRLRVVNSGAEELRFTGALHSYFRVGDITQSHVEGLGEQPYLDNLDKRSQHTLPAGPLRFDREVDRIFVGAPPDIEVVDAARGHMVAVRRHGWADAVVWNPWVEKAKATGDFGDEEYKEMICVEAAVAPSGPVVVPPGQDTAWTASQTLVYRTMS